MDRTIQIIFTVTLLVLWALFGVGLANGAWTGTNWAMLSLAHLACGIVFVNFAYLFTYGYALSMLLVHGAVLVLVPTPAGFLLAGLGVAYGIRLWWFIWRRYQSSGYAAIRARGDKADAGIPLPARLFMWIAVSWLMAFSGMAAFHVAVAATVTPWVLAGAVVAGAGLLLEAVADGQKQAAKAQEPGRFVRSGLYARARHPNFLGEIVFQLGFVIALLGIAASGYAVATGLAAPAYIMVLMFSEGRKADREQDKRYGEDPDYREYRRRTRCFLPGF